MSPGVFRWYAPVEEVPLVAFDDVGDDACGWRPTARRRSSWRLRLGMAAGLALILLLTALLLVRSDPVAAQNPSSLRGTSLYQYHHGVNLGGWLVMEAWLFPNVPLMHAGRLGLRENQEWDYISRMRHLHIDAIRTMHNLWNSYLMPDLMGATDPGPWLRDLRARGVSHVRVPVGWWITEAPTEVPDPYRNKPVPTNREWGYTKDGFVTGAIVYLEQLLRLLKKVGIRVLIDMHALPGGQVKQMGYTGRWFESADFFNGADRWYADGDPWSRPTPSRQGGNDFLVQGVTALHRLAHWIAAMDEDPATAGVVMGLSLWNEALFADDVKARQLLGPCTLKIVPQLRRFLPSSRFAIVLNWFNHALDWAEWMAVHRAELGDAVIADVHIYHTFDLPQWAAGCPKCSTSREAKGSLVCKSCSDDAWQLSGWSKNNIPFIVGEWTVANCDMYGTHPGIVTDPDFLYAWYAAQKAVFRNYGVDGDYYWTGLVRTGGYDPTLYVPVGIGSRDYVEELMRALAKDRGWALNNKWKMSPLVPSPDDYLLDWHLARLQTLNTSRGHPVALPLGCEGPDTLCVIPSLLDMCQFTPAPAFAYRGQPGCKVDPALC
jgi:hypothetical protein